jgi:KDO2-lipid IV(A) lauroyltransferase
MKYSTKHIAEYIPLVLVGGLVRILPLRAALALGWMAAAATHFLGRVKVERTHQRIQQVFGDQLSEKEIRRIAWHSWRNLFFNGIEALRFSKLTLKKIRRQPIVRLAPELNKMLKECAPGGFILATPHLGNWEIAGVVADLSDIPLFAIARRQKNPLVDAYINKMRRSFGFEILLSSAHMGKGVVDRIKAGKILAILPDIGRRAGGVTVDFLQGKAAISPGAAQFAQLARCPIFPVCVRRIGWTRHDAVLLSPIYPDPSQKKEVDQQRMMQELMSALSAEILKTPDQYFWYNKRWVLKTPS